MPKTIPIMRNVFLLVGLAMLAGAVYAWRSTTATLATAVRAEGDVVGMDRSSNSSTYRPVVRFSDREGRQHEFTSKYGSSPPRYHAGDKAPVLYPPGQPQRAETADWVALWMLPTILAGLGVIFSAVGAGMIWLPRRRRRQIELLKERGRPISADFQSVQLNTSISVNQQNPFQILCQWQDPATAKLHVFKSDNIWFDPTSYIKSKTLRVYVAEGDPSSCYVDLSFLPELAQG